MKRIGITGQNGFIGQHLYNTLGLFPKEFTCVEFKKSYFDDENALQKFVNSCDVIVHLAALNRDSNPQNIYTTNILLVNKLIKVLSKKTTKTHLLFSSSLQEEQSNLYGKSKKEGRELFIKWARETNNTFTGLVVPNVFGPFGKPFYNSFIATFCHLLVQNSEPTIEKDSEVNLIYVLELINYILEQIRSNSHLEFLEVPSTTTKKVSEVLEILQDFKNNYFDLGIIPNLPTPFHKNLFNTYRSYIDYPSIFPKKYFLHSDDRGTFVELIKMQIGGQSSYSTTKTNITRGNHFHTRKIERFSVISGEAKIELRKINTSEKLEFYLSGDEPSYVDMPIWYTHNITNIGKGDLFTFFWIDEPYNALDADTYHEIV